MPGPSLEPFQQIAEFVRDQRQRHAEELDGGRWQGEVAGKMLVARIAMCDDIYEKMRTISGNDTHFGERDL